MKLLPHTLASLSIAVLVSACSGAAATPPATAPIAAAPTTAATIAPVPTDAATTMALPTDVVPTADAPTAAPAANALLPAPFYMVRGDHGDQIVRVERDGKTQTPITKEPIQGFMTSIVELAVSPVDSALAYVIQTNPGMALIVTDADGGKRTVLFQNRYTYVDTPLWSPDGKTLAVAMNQESSTNGGIYLLPAGGGEPKLLQANGTAPIPPTATIDPQAFGYRPLAFSPDGTKLLAARDSLQVEQCGLAVISVADGALTTFASPDPALGPICRPATWSTDSRAVYTTFTLKDDNYNESAGLWQVDATTGKATPVVPRMVDKQLVVASSPVSLRAGEISAFIAQTAALPSLGNQLVPPLLYQMARIEAGSGTWVVMRKETYTDVDSVTWAPDGSGALLQVSNNTLIWLPSDGSAAQIIGENLNASSWGR